MTIGKSQVVRGMDFLLPDVAAGTGNGVNNLEVGAGTYKPLPTYPVRVDMSNPHPRASLTCLVYWSAWIYFAGDVGLQLFVSPVITQGGAIWMAAGTGHGGPYGNGEILQVEFGTDRSYCQSFTVDLSPSGAPYTFEIWAWGEAANDIWQSVRYPCIRVIPINYKVSTT